MCKDSFFYRKVAGFRIKSYICKDEKYLNDCIMETCPLDFGRLVGF